MNLTNRIYTNEAAARAHLERLLWANGRVCPHCGTVDNSAPLKGKSTRPGVYKCREKTCRKPFSVTVGTVFERSHVPLNNWVLATHLLTASKKGMSAHQISRMLEVTYKTAWFMMHRIREAMVSPDTTMLGGGGTEVEADETYIGREPGEPITTGGNHKMKVLTLVDRATGRSRSRVLDFISAKAITKIVLDNISGNARLMTDEARHYVKVGEQFAFHGHTNHRAKEYVSRTDPRTHTNTVEGFFSIFKRGMKGVYQHCGKQHLQRYLAEFDFRYTNRIAVGVNDDMRAAEALRGIVGKRLTYRRTDDACYA